MSARRPIHVVLAAEIWEALDSATNTAGMSKTKVIEAMIANAAGMPGYPVLAVNRAWSTHRRRQSEATL